jgi:hypothetical protein
MFGVLGFAELGTLGATNYASLCSFSSRGAFSIQGPTYGEPTKKLTRKD